jgi:transposase
LNFLPQQQYEALREARLRDKSAERKKLFAKRAGIEGTISQAVRVNGLRRCRYRGLAKTCLQHVATAVAVNIDRLVNWFNGIPRGGTTISQFAALGLAA